MLKIIVHTIGFTFHVMPLVYCPTTDNQISICYLGYRFTIFSKHDNLKIFPPKPYVKIYVIENIAYTLALLIIKTTSSC